MAEASGTRVESGRTYDFIYGRLILLNMNPDKAKAYANFCQDMYDYIQNNHDLAEGFKNIAIANKLQPMARELELTKSVGVLGDVRLSGVAGITNIFVDYFKALAAHYGIEINECSLSIAKVCLDIGSAGVGALSSVTGVGWVWLGLSVVATYQDSFELSRVCLISQ
jgi:hypothetical protein